MTEQIRNIKSGWLIEAPSQGHCRFLSRPPEGERQSEWVSKFEDAHLFPTEREAWSTIDKYWKLSSDQFHVEAVMFNSGPCCPDCGKVMPPVKTEGVISHYYCQSCGRCYLTPEGRKQRKPTLYEYGYDNLTDPTEEILLGLSDDLAYHGQEVEAIVNPKGKERRVFELILHYISLHLADRLLLIETDQVRD